MPVVLANARQILVQFPAEAGAELAGAVAAGAEMFVPGWLAASPRTGRRQHPWDEAHRLVRDPAAAGLENLAHPVYAEPDLIQAFPILGPEDVPLESIGGTRPCTESDPDDYWPVGAPRVGWHLDDAHSALKSARDAVGNPAARRVRVAILDTGYDPDHATLPQFFHSELQRNYVDGDVADATDPGRHFPWNQPGHGTATMALLAGRQIALPRMGFNDYLGGAPHAEVVMVRIADSVAHFQTSAMAKGINYAAEIGCDVVSISMGGIPARAWAAAVNRAYEAGVAIFAAAGNRIGPSPPRTIVYPARFNRVAAVCGVTADRSPYYRPGLHRHMQGCFGPPAKMATALAAWTPNAPWAVMGCGGLIGFGGGTSSATPQAAAAAALWLQSATIPNGVERWQRVEAVRWALFSSADRDVPDVDKYFGNGLLRARAALDVPFRGDLPMSPPDAVSFPWLRQIGILEAGGGDLAEEAQMYEVEALQVFSQTPFLQDLVGGADPIADSISPSNAKELIGAMRASPMASQALQTRLDAMYRRL